MTSSPHLSYEAAKYLAEKLGVPHVSTLTNHLPNDGLFNPAHAAFYHAHQFLPYARVNDRTVIATSAPSQALAELLDSLYGKHALVIASSRDITRWIGERAQTYHIRRAVHALRRRFKRFSAYQTFLPRQIIGLILPLVMLGALLILVPHMSAMMILTLCCMFYFASLLFKQMLFARWQSLNPPTQPVGTLASPAPIYSIFVPLFREPPQVIAQLIAALETLDYPAESKDVMLICEADDAATIAAIKAIHPPSYMRIIYVPASLPRTKPKALNVALAYARGEFGVIYDAEDIPHTLQLREAAARFQATPELACLQAPLNYYNREENLLTQCFAIEYGSLFGIHLPALESLNLPIPLGGTSNHLRMQTLRELGAWDAFNVTEDADLGMRLAVFGYQTGMLSVGTMEEAPIRLGAWLKQRSRWMKGYMQTWLVYMRDPKELKRTLGKPAYYGFQFFIGAPALTFLIAPLFWAVFLASLSGLITLHLPLWLQALCMLCFCGGVLQQWVYAKATLSLHGWQGMRKAAMLYPCYWLLHTLASFMALVDLLMRPHHWQKTSHGQSRMRTGLKKPLTAGSPTVSKAA